MTVRASREHVTLNFGVRRETAVLDWFDHASRELANRNTWRRTDLEGSVDDVKRVITFGTFDVLHVGHLRILQRARALGDYLIVGVSSDELNVKKKGRLPVFTEAERMTLIGSLRCVDRVFLEESLELKGHYIQRERADVLVMGDDWAGRFDELGDLCEVVYLPRTPAISTTAVIEKIAREAPPG